jgi:hypothetical protein
VKEGDEQSTRRIDDLQLLLGTINVPFVKAEISSYSDLPTNYLQWKRVDITAKKGCCNDRRMSVYLAEEGNLNQLLFDNAKRPSFEWAETFATLKNNKVNVYTNNEFEISKGSLTYYRQPVRIEVLGCVDPYTSIQTTVDIESEFKDDIVELLIDEAASILAGDIESGNQFSRGTETAERNN